MSIIDVYHYYALKKYENFQLNEQKNAAENAAKAEAAKIKKYKDQAIKQFNHEWSQLAQPLEDDLKVIQEPLQHLEKLHHLLRDAFIGCRLGIKSSIDRILDNPQAWHLFKQSNALHIAADANQKSLLEFLLSKGFNVLSRDFNGKLPIDLAIEKGNIELAEFLQKIQLEYLLKEEGPDSSLNALMPKEHGPAHCYQIPLLAKLPQGEEVTLYEYEMPGQGECGYHSLGIPREWVAKRLLENAHRVDIRLLIQEEIFDNVDDLPESMLNDKSAEPLPGFLEMYHSLQKDREEFVDKLKLEQPHLKSLTIEDLKKKLDPETKKILEDKNSKIADTRLLLKNCCATPSVFEAYVKHYIGTSPHPLTVIPKSSSSLDAISELFQINIYIWHSPDGKHLNLYHFHNIGQKSDSIHILYKDGHYNRLCLKSDLKIYPTSIINVNEFIPESQIPKQVSENCISDVLEMLDKVQDKLKSRPSRKDHDEVRKSPEQPDDSHGKLESVKDKLNNLAILREQELALDSLVKFEGYKNKAADFLDHYQLQLDKLKAVYALYYNMLEANPYNILMLSGFLICGNLLQGMQKLKVTEDAGVQINLGLPEEKVISEVLEYLLNQWALHRLLNEIGFESLEKSIDYVYKHPLDAQYQSIFNFVNDTTIVCLMLSTKLSCHNKETFLKTQELTYYQEGLKLAFSQVFQACLGGSDEDLLDSISFIEEIARNFILIHQQGGKAEVLQQLRESIQSLLGISTLTELMRECRINNCYQVKDKEIDSIIKEYNIDLIDSISDEYVTHSLVYGTVFREIGAKQDLVRQAKQKIIEQLAELTKMKSQEYQELLTHFKKADATFQKGKNKQAQFFNAYENALKQHQAERARIFERNNKNTVIGFGINVGLGGSGSSLSCFPSMRVGNHRFTLDPAYRNPSRPILQLKYGNASSCSSMSKESLIHNGKKTVDRALAAALHRSSNAHLGTRPDEATFNKSSSGAFALSGSTTFTSNTKNLPSSNLQSLALKSKPFGYMFERVTHNIANLVFTSPIYAKQQPPGSNPRLKTSVTGLQKSGYYFPTKESLQPKIPILKNTPLLTTPQQAQEMYAELRRNTGNKEKSSSSSDINYKVQSESGINDNVIYVGTHSVVKGIFNAFGGLANIIWKPWDNFVYPLSKLASNATITTTVSSKRWLDMDHSGFSGDQQILIGLIEKQPHIGHKASEELQVWFNSLKSAVTCLPSSSWPKKVEWASELVTAWYAPGALLKDVKAAKAAVIPSKGKSLPIFGNRKRFWEKMPEPEVIVPLSVQEVRQLQNEVLMYVIRTDKKLIITRQDYDHWHLVIGNHGSKLSRDIAEDAVYAAGDLYIDKAGRISRFDNRSGSYAPQGPHLGSFEHIFVEYGFPEAMGKFFDHAEHLNNFNKFRIENFRKLGFKNTFVFEIEKFLSFSKKPKIINNESRVPSIIFSTIGASSHSLLHQDRRLLHIYYSRDLKPYFDDNLNINIAPMLNTNETDHEPRQKNI